MKSLSHHLADLLHNNRIGLTTVVAIAAALAADARYNMWFYDNVKSKLPESEIFAAMDKSHELVAACKAAIQKFNQDNNLPELEAALEVFTKSITDAMVILR
jgi:hypothetical protein